MYKKKSRKNSDISFSGIFGRVAIVLLIIFAIVMVTQMCYTLNENEDAVVFTFGKPSLVSESGLHFAIPVVQNVYKCNTAMQGLSIGYDAYNNPVEQRTSILSMWISI